MYRTGYFTLGPTLHPFLASARHMIGLVGVVFVLTFTAIELVPLPALTVQIVVAMEDILARVSPQPLIVACAPVEDILAPASPEHLVVAFAPVGHVTALAAAHARSAPPPPPPRRPPRPRPPRASPRRLRPRGSCHRHRRRP